MKEIGPEALARVESFFWENFEQRGELGASLSIWHRGREIVSLAGGFMDRRKERPWTAQTPVLVWSATKGPSAACVLHALARHDESLQSLVALLWPEFGRGGKEQITVGELLSHAAGLAAMEAEAPVLDHGAVAAALAAQAPNWPPGEGQGHGYHPRTFGFLLDELVRRLEGVSLGEYWRTWFGIPLGLDFWIGAPAEKLPEVSPVYPAKVGKAAQSPQSAGVNTAGAGDNGGDDLFYRAFADLSSLTARAFASPHGCHGVASMNTPEVQMASLPGFGGIGTAHALGKFYAMLAGGGALDGIRFFSSLKSLEAMTTTRSEGFDRVLLRETAFSAGFMRDPLDGEGKKRRQLFGPSLMAFGQPGAGGCHAFADPENNLAFAYVMNQMETGVMPHRKAMGLVEAVYG